MKCLACIAEIDLFFLSILLTPREPAKMRVEYLSRSLNLDSATFCSVTLIQTSLNCGYIICSMCLLENFYHRNHRIKLERDYFYKSIDPNLVVYSKLLWKSMNICQNFSSQLFPSESNIEICK